MDFSAVLTKEFLLSYEGRLNRAQLWAFILLYLAGVVIAGILDGLIGTGGLLGAVYALAIIYPSICVYARRWHDRDKSGWWSLIALVPLIGALWILIECGCLKGTDGPNRFGPDPLGGS